jgi:hypothetical protein
MLGIDSDRRFVLRSNNDAGTPFESRKFDTSELKQVLHVVATHSGRQNQANSTTLVKVYVNGVAEIDHEQAMGANSPYSPVLNFVQAPDRHWHVLGEGGSGSGENRAFIGVFYLAAAYARALSAADVQELFALGKDRALADYTTAAPTPPTNAPTPAPSPGTPASTPTVQTGTAEDDASTTSGTDQSSTSSPASDSSGPASGSARSDIADEGASGPEALLLIAIILPLVVCLVCLAVALIIRRRRRDPAHSATMSTLGSAGSGSGSSMQHSRSRRQSVSKRHRTGQPAEASDGVYGAVLPALSGKHTSTYDQVSNYDMIGGPNVPTAAAEYDTVQQTVDRRSSSQQQANYDTVDTSMNRRNAGSASSYDSVGVTLG